AAILEHAFATEPVELRDAERFDLLLATDAELLLDLDLDGQAVRVPARFARHAKSLHRAIAAEKIFDRAREDVMDAGLAVRRRRPLEEHERRRALAGGQRLLEEILGVPAREQLALEVVRRAIRRQQPVL